MGGIIIFSDGRAWTASSWAYDEAIRYIAKELSATNDNALLVDWLLQQTCEVNGLGLGRIDMRELTNKNQKSLIIAIHRAVININTVKPNNWQDESYYANWKTRFLILAQLLDSIEKGEPPEKFNPHMNDIIPLTGKKSGPGWNK